MRPALFWVAVLVLFVLSVWLLKSILLPFVAGMAVAYLFDPPCDWLVKKGLSRTGATALMTLLFLLFLILLAALVLPLVISQLISLAARVPDLVGEVQGLVAVALDWASQKLDPEMMQRLRDAIGSSAGQVIDILTGTIRGVLSAGSSVLNLLSLLVITPIVAFFLLRDWDDMVARIQTWLPRPHEKTIRQLTHEVDRTLAGFARGTSTVCTILAVFYAIALTVAGLDFGLVVGLIAGGLSFIPFVGAIIGALLSVGLAFLQFDVVTEWERIVIVAVIFAVGQAVEGNYLTPKLVGGQVGLHAVWVMFALLAGGVLAGFLGVLLAVPVAAVIGVGARFALRQYLASPYYLGDGGSGGPTA